MSVGAERRLKIYDYLDTPLEEREMSERDFRKTLRMSFPIYKGVKDEWRAQRGTPKRDVKEAIGMIERGLEEGDERWVSVEQAIYEAAMKGTVKAQELYARLKGKLIDKQEIKVGRLEDDDYYRIRNEARRELKPRREEGNQGDREMQPVTALLLEAPCSDTEQDNEKDS